MDPAGNKMITVLVVRDVSVEHALVDRSTAQVRGYYRSDRPRVTLPRQAHLPRQGGESRVRPKTIE